MPNERPAPGLFRVFRTLTDAAVSPSVFAVLSIIWCLDLGIGSLIAYRRPDLFGAMDALPFASWLARFGRQGMPLSLWVYLLAVLSWLMVASLLFCTVNWLLRRRRRLLGLGEFLVHLGFLLVFAGFVIGSISGARSQGVLVPPGEQVPVPGMRVSLRLSTLETVRSPEGETMDTVSRVTLVENGLETASGRVGINHPLISGPLVVYPRGSAPLLVGAWVNVIGQGRVNLLRDVTVRTDDGGSLGSWGILQEGQRRGPHAGPGLFLVRRNAGGEVVRSGFLAPLPGRTELDLDGLRIGLDQFQAVTAGRFDVHRDPGVWLVIIGALCLLAGTLWALAGYLGQAGAGCESAP